MNPSCDCIVPFYNEGQRVVAVVRALSRVPSIGNIICVDDGSTDNASKKIKKEFPHITLILLSKNSGKSQAVFAGLRRVTNDTVLLFDGDALNVQPDEVDAVCRKFFDFSLDMLIFRIHGQKQYKLMDDFFRNYIIQSGDRILKTDDLRAAEKFHPTGYQIEVAINQYMMDKKKRVAWSPISALNLHKTTKFSFFSGWKKDLAMDREIMSYLGPTKRLRQILFFCRKRVL